MDSELRTEWINALLDDDNASLQGTSVLAYKSSRDNKIYRCCWGVYLDILADRDLVSRHFDEVTREFEYRFNGEVVRGYPTDEMLELANIDIGAGPDGHIVYYLAGRNDSGSNFAYIASEILEYL